MKLFSFDKETEELLNNFAEVTDVLREAFLFEDNGEQSVFWQTVRDKIYEILEKDEY